MKKRGFLHFHPGLLAAAITAVAWMVICSLAWVVAFAGQSVSADSAKWADFGSYFGGTLAPVLAFSSFIGLLVSIQDQAQAHRAERERQDSFLHYDHATRNLERAFREFMGNDEQATEPVSDRLVWLTTARLILSAKRAAAEITVPSISRMYQGDEEFWRRQFYDVLQHLDQPTPFTDANYFRRGDQGVRGNVIEERSIRVVADFIEWPAEQEDPIDAIPRYTDAELGSLPHSKRGIREYILYLRRTRDGTASDEGHG